uniref:Putative conserved secreted protein n=1 Tax=Amblyomma tuberculatum TaxID=48802 RepID=A0A6M2E0N8_9ACAR
MTPAKLLSFALLAASFLAMIGLCSSTSSGGRNYGYGNDNFRQCPGTCYINPDGRTAAGYQCPPKCHCISDGYNSGVYTGYGTCWGPGQ